MKILPLFGILFLVILCGNVSGSVIRKKIIGLLPQIKKNDETRKEATTEKPVQSKKQVLNRLKESAPLTYSSYIKLLHSDEYVDYSKKLSNKANKVRVTNSHAVSSNDLLESNKDLQKLKNDTTETEFGSVIEIFPLKERDNHKSKSEKKGKRIYDLKNVYLGEQKNTSDNVMKYSETKEKSELKKAYDEVMLLSGIINSTSDDISYSSDKQLNDSDQNEEYTGSLQLDDNDLSSDESSEFNVQSDDGVNDNRLEETTDSDELLQKDITNDESNLNARSVSASESKNNYSDKTEALGSAEKVVILREQENTMADSKENTQRNHELKDASGEQKNASGSNDAYVNEEAKRRILEMQLKSISPPNDLITELLSTTREDTNLINHESLMDKRRIGEEEIVNLIDKTMDNSKNIETRHEDFIADLQVDKDELKLEDTEQKRNSEMKEAIMSVIAQASMESSRNYNDSSPIVNSLKSITFADIQELLEKIKILAKKIEAALNLATEEDWFENINKLPVQHLQVNPQGELRLSDPQEQDKDIHPEQKLQLQDRPLNHRFDLLLQDFQNQALNATPEMPGINPEQKLQPQDLQDSDINSPLKMSKGELGKNDANPENGLPLLDSHNHGLYPQEELLQQVLQHYGADTEQKLPPKVPQHSGAHSEQELLMKVSQYFGVNPQQVLLPLQNTQDNDIYSQPEMLKENLGKNGVNPLQELLLLDPQDHGISLEQKLQLMDLQDNDIYAQPEMPQQDLQYLEVNPYQELSMQGLQDQGIKHEQILQMMDLQENDIYAPPEMPQQDIQHLEVNPYQEVLMQGPQDQGINTLQELPLLNPQVHGINPEQKLQLIDLQDNDIHAPPEMPQHLEVNPYQELSMQGPQDQTINTPQELPLQGFQEHIYSAPEMPIKELKTYDVNPQHDLPLHDLHNHDSYCQPELPLQYLQNHDVNSQKELPLPYLQNYDVNSQQQLPLQYLQNYDVNSQQQQPLQYPQNHDVISKKELPLPYLQNYDVNSQQQLPLQYPQNYDVNSQQQLPLQYPQNYDVNSQQQLPLQYPQNYDVNSQQQLPLQYPQNYDVNSQQQLPLQYPQNYDVNSQQQLPLQYPQNYDVNSQQQLPLQYPQNYDVNSQQQLPLQYPQNYDVNSQQQLPLQYPQNYDVNSQQQLPLQDQGVNPQEEIPLQNFQGQVFNFQQGIPEPVIQEQFNKDVSPQIGDIMVPNLSQVADNNFMKNGPTEEVPSQVMLPGGYNVLPNEPSEVVEKDINLSDDMLLLRMLTNMIQQSRDHPVHGTTDSLSGYEIYSLDEPHHHTKKILIID